MDKEFGRKNVFGHVLFRAFQRIQMMIHKRLNSEDTHFRECLYLVQKGGLIYSFIFTKCFILDKVTNKPRIHITIAAHCRAPCANICRITQNAIYNSQYTDCHVSGSWEETGEPEGNNNSTKRFR